MKTIMGLAYMGYAVYGIYAWAMGAPFTARDFWFFAVIALYSRIDLLERQ